MELTEVGYIEAAREGARDDRTRTAAPGPAQIGDSASRRRGDWQRFGERRYYGISRNCYYKWRNRYDEYGETGLRDRSSRPHYSPNETDPDVVGKIIYLRQTYHFGPHKISMYLKRYHDIDLALGVWQILKRLDMNRLPTSQRHKRHAEGWKRYEKPQPGPRVQIDVKFVAPMGVPQEALPVHRDRRLHQDPGPRIYDRWNQATSIRFLDYVLEKLPFRVEVIQTDNGAEFQSQFHYHVLDRGIRHVYIRPATPRLNGKVERSHRIDVEEFYACSRAS